MQTHSICADMVATDLLTQLLIRMNWSSPKRIFSLLALLTEKMGIAQPHDDRFGIYN
jgi:hypothetical protein